MNKKVRKKVGLALGGGGAKGFAHIGVLKALEKEKIKIDCISGTSIGALIGAIYCSRPDANALEKFFMETDLKSLLDYTLSKSGFIDGKKIEESLKKNLKSKTFKHLKIPLYVTAFDLESEREIIFSKGSVVKAVRASISLPGIFKPVLNNGEVLIDGGVIDPVPVEILKKRGGDLTIAVDVTPVKEKKPLYGEYASRKKTDKTLPSIVSSLTRGLNFLGALASEADLIKSKADVTMGITVKLDSLFDFKDIKKTILLGEKSAQKKMPQIKKLLGIKM